MNNRSTRELVWEILEDDNSTHPLSKIDDYLVTIAILASIGLVIISSNTEVYENNKLVIIGANTLLDVIFLIEYSLRVWSAGSQREYRGWKKLNFIFRPMSLVDLISLLPVLQVFGESLRIFRVIRFVRILRAFKLIRYNKTLKQLIDTIRIALPSLVNMFFLVLIAILILATILWNFEHSAQPDKFGDILSSLWPSAITLTTIGYGDIYPITFWGKVSTVIFHIFGGSFLVGLPLVIVGDAWSKAEKES